MRIPRAWFRAEGEAETPARQRWRLVAWGWGEDEGQARAAAAARLARRIERVRSGIEGASRDDYEYAARPPREELLESLGEDAVLTRNRYGAVVLNAAGLLVLDVDLPEGGRGLLARWLGRPDPAARAQAELERALATHAPGTTFRLYRTAAGLRALAVDRTFDPAGEETQALMRATGTDPAFARLCRAQTCFRARLTPKPWRCGCALPPGQHPRDEPGMVERFAVWREAYARAIEGYAACRSLTTVGTGRPAPALARLIELHDRASRCDADLPLA